jgi:transcriptional regulator with XRE-family HTH domain
MARPTKWIELNMDDKLDSVRGWAKNGSTDEDIAKMLGISTALYYQWKKEKIEFMEAIKKGKEVANGELLNSAFTQSVGFFYKEQQTFKVKDYKLFGDELKQIERLETVEVEKFSPPNPTMNIFMLKNRLPSDYRDKHELDVDATMSIKIEGEVKEWAK